MDNPVLQDADRVVLVTSATVHSTHATDVIDLTQDGANSPHVPRYLPLLIPSLDDENLEDSAEDSAEDCRRLPKTAEELVEDPAEEPEVEEEDTQDASDKDFFKYTYFTDACNGWCEKL
ncbi:hypothetical protein PG994_004274 [Apiospora phragmitis]|uniref:Uncharacterized protein n=1 Tax=Apiospora phragmitis TaxID=2905665 RepID=A0ABR1VQ56_9PEZI